MNPKLHALMRGMNLQPEEAVEQINPAIVELLGQIQVLLEGALGKAPQPRQPGPRAAAFLRSMEPLMPQVVPYTAPLQPRKSGLPIESRVVARDENGRIAKVAHATADGRSLTSTTRRDAMGRMVSVTHVMDGRPPAVSKIRRDGVGRIVSSTLTAVGQDAVHTMPQDADSAMVSLLAKAVEDNSPSDQLYESGFVPNRNPLPRVYVQRNHTGEPVFINCGNRQIPINKVRAPTANVAIQYDAENRPFVTVRGWKMRVTYDREGLVQALEPMDEGG